MKIKLLISTAFIITFLFTSNKNVSAQTYYPMLQIYNEWDEYVNIIPVVQIGINNMPYQSGSITTSDTVIGGVAYKKVYSMSDGNSGGNGHARFIREDTTAKKVYLLSADSLTERLLYDFSMALGDSTFLEWQYPATNGFNNGYYKLDSTGVKTTLAGLRTVYYLSSSANQIGTFPPLVLEWIESIGSTISPVYLDEDFGGGIPLFQISGCNKFYLSLSCAFADSMATYHDSCIAVLYTMATLPIGDTCIFNLGGGIDEYSFSDLSITASPNPFTDFTTLKISGENLHHYSALTLKLIDALGREQQSITIDHTDFESGIAFGKQNLAGGIYFVQLYDNSVLKAAKKIIIEK